jgi:hypothetical protein
VLYISIFDNISSPKSIFMLVISQHTIQNPEEFWKATKTITSILPSNLKLYSVYASLDKKNCTCVWECSSQKDIQSLLDKQWGSWCKTWCWEVNTATSLGLPKTALATEALHN